MQFIISGIYPENSHYESYFLQRATSMAEDEKKTTLLAYILYLIVMYRGGS